MLGPAANAPPAKLHMTETNVKPIRLRDQKKADKLQRIRSAAASLFSEQGYESTTMRTIANRAHVAVGTVFLYAKDKRDLVFLIFNEELDMILERAFRFANPEKPFLEQLVSVFSTFYAEFSKNPPLSRILLKELTFLSEGIHSEHFQERRRTMIKKIEALVASAQENGSIRSHENPAFIARHIYFVYAGAIRWWFAGPEPQLPAGIAELRRQFRLTIAGLEPTPAALASDPRTASRPRSTYSAARRAARVAAASAAVTSTTAGTVRAVALPLPSRLARKASTSAEPTTTPSAPRAIAAA